MRVLFCGDMHCGSQVGLTPPGWQYKLDGPKKTIGRQQRECWNFYTQQIEALKPFDMAVINGDIIDGDGYRNSGKEHSSTCGFNTLSKAWSSLLDSSTVIKKDRFLS